MNAIEIDISITLIFTCSLKYSGFAAQLLCLSSSSLLHASGASGMKTLSLTMRLLSFHSDEFHC